ATVAAAATLVDELCAELADELGHPGPPQVDGSQFGDGYGIPTGASREAMRLFARTEGIVLDPVYTSKAAAWLIDACRSGSLEAPVVFVHTGGSPGLFAYGTDAFTPPSP
ncbi:MAG: pyridoxal-phosphate dependent enzyme, partial [Microthrixaceae bacterium]